jgi:3-isopropylmalate/(R)-2-methylmalate dehydratase small subunit
VDTDVIFPARHMNTTDRAELARHALEDLDPDFVRRVRPGDYIFAEENFGCGSSREQAPLAIKEAGIRCIVAKSYARIFFRNAINIGLPILVCSGAVDDARHGEEAEVDLEAGTLRVGGALFQAAPFPPFLQRLIEMGGLMPYVRDEIAREASRLGKET